MAKFLGKYWVPILSILILIAVVKLFTCNKPMPEKPKIEAAKDIVKIVNNNEAILKQKLDSLEYKQSLLLKQNKTLAISLAIAQNNNKLAAKAVNNIVKNDTQNKYTDDYILALNETIVRDLINNAATSDSLCNENITNLNKQIELKDTTINQKDLLYSQLRLSFNKVADNQAQLETYSSELKKQLRRKKVGNFFWKAVAIGLAGLATYQTIK